MKYLLDNPNSIIPPILLSSRNHWIYTKDGSSDLGNIEIKGRAAIVDGQHRAGGFILLSDEKEIIVDVPFILLLDLTKEDEKNEFVTINNSQKGVPKPLTRPNQYPRLPEHRAFGFQRRDSLLEGKHPKGDSADRVMFKH